jgi:hypothetical protein
MRSAKAACSRATLKLQGRKMMILRVWIISTQRANDRLDRLLLRVRGRPTRRITKGTLFQRRCVVCGGKAGYSKYMIEPRGLHEDKVMQAIATK